MTQWHEDRLGTVDAEIAKLAFACDIKILDPGVVERVVKGDATVCGRKNEKAFRQLRALVAMHYSLTSETINSVGANKSAELLDRIRAQLGKRFDLGSGRR